MSVFKRGKQKARIGITTSECVACVTEGQFPRRSTKWEAEQAESKIRQGGL